MKKLFSKYRCFLLISFLFLLTSFYSNFWNIAPQDDYENFEIFCESMVWGRLARSEKDGIFSHSGFVGANYDRSLFSTDTLKTQY